MQWTDDVSRGDWIRERLQRTKTVTGYVPFGFESYARIFPKVEMEQVSELDDGRDTPNEFWTWSKLAASTGKTMHPSAQWQRIVGLGDDPMPEIADGWVPDEVAYDANSLSDLTTLLRLLPTTTPDDITLAFFASWSARQKGATVKLRRWPGPRYALLNATTSELLDPEWTNRDDNIRSQVIYAGRPDAAIHCDFIWPADRSWCIATDWDLDTALVGGDAAAIDAVVSSPDLEALQIRPGANLSALGDVINR